MNLFVCLYAIILVLHLFLVIFMVYGLVASKRNPYYHLHRSLVISIAVATVFNRFQFPLEPIETTLKDTGMQVYLGKAVTVSTFFTSKVETSLLLCGLVILGTFLLTSYSKAYSSRRKTPKRD